MRRSSILNLFIFKVLGKFFGCQIFSLVLTQASKKVSINLGQVKSAKLKDKEYTINAQSFYATFQKKEIDALSFYYFSFK